MSRARRARQRANRARGREQAAVIAELADRHRIEWVESSQEVTVRLPHGFVTRPRLRWALRSRIIPHPGNWGHR